MPSTVGRIQDLSRLTPVFEIGRRSRRLAPPKPRRSGCSRFSQPNPRKNRLIALLPLDHAEIKNFFLGGNEYFMFAPVRPAVRALRKPLDQMVLHIRPGDVPHLPLAFGVDNVGLIHTSMLPSFFGKKYGFWLIDPLASVPFQITNRVRPPEIDSTARIVDSLNPDF